MKPSLTWPMPGQAGAAALGLQLRRWWPLAYAAALAALVYAAFHWWAYDDPFITYRYADNLRRGLGFVYNPGERVLSTTTPLFTMLLAGLGYVWPDLPRLARLIGAVSLAAGGLCLWDLGRSWKTPWAGLAGLMLYPLWPLLLATLGSETPLYLALCLGAFAAYARQRLAWAAGLASLALLTRADGGLVGVLLAVDFAFGWLRARRPIPWAAVGVCLGLVVPWVAFALWYFGSPLPATLAAKQHQGSLAESVRFAPGFWLLVQAYARYWGYVVMAGLAALGLAAGLRQGSRWGLILLWGLAYFLAYTVLGVSRYYWYYAPLVPAWVALVGLGVEAGARLAGKFQGRQGRAVMAALVPALLLVLFVFQAYQAWGTRDSRDPRVSIYRAAGEWLRAGSESTASVGSLEVGIIGYYAQRPMLDFAGLIQPAVAQQLTPATTYEDAARWAIDTYRPDYLVLHPAWFPAVMESHVRPHCSSAQVLQGAQHGYEGDLVIYVCEW